MCKFKYFLISYHSIEWIVLVYYFENIGKLWSMKTLRRVSLKLKSFIFSIKLYLDSKMFILKTMLELMTNKTID